jgi:hypothetical protein
MISVLCNFASLPLLSRIHPLTRTCCSIRAFPCEHTLRSSHLSRHVVLFRARSLVLFSWRSLARARDVAAGTGAKIATLKVDWDKWKDEDELNGNDVSAESLRREPGL